ncbi:TolC family protein [Phenylobacterium sp. 58.2.17]|jgi:outer membrane protein, heavy metal efflux system|uniref:TolC family protein n=1 Tax=Phenylobacterium sp. 58.2.17 TaxID=2969306 RepID=UPI0022643547|nr:TolC family protein [Phenylobacterium sp. 58.2.17]MCX7586352.1 TolC family protein [Phenylobacterium sp. 58.2.17]
MKLLHVLPVALIATSASAEPLTYAEALRRATESAPSVEASALEVTAARAAERAAGKLPDPKLALGVDNYPVSGPDAGRFGDDEMTMAQIGVQQDVPNAARRRAQVAVARADSETAAAGAALEARKARVAAALAWIDLSFAEHRLASLDQLTKGLEGLWRGQPAAVASGAARPAAGLSPARLGAEFADRRAELVAQVARARAELTRWTGDPAPSTAGPAPRVDIDEAALRAGLAAHPTIAAALAANHKAIAEVDGARAAKRPDWGFEVSYGRRDPMFGDMVSAGMTMTLPIFSGSRQEPAIAARVAEAGRARAQAEDLRRSLYAALEADLADHEMHHEQWRRSVDVLVPTAEQTSHLEVESYGAGRAALPDVVEAMNGLADAKLTALEREAIVVRDGARIQLTYGSAQ